MVESGGLLGLMEGWWQEVSSWTVLVGWILLSQVEDWDHVEEVREPTLEETEAKKEVKDPFKKWVTLEEIH